MVLLSHFSSDSDEAHGKSLLQIFSNHGSENGGKSMHGLLSCHREMHYHIPYQAHTKQ